MHILPLLLSHAVVFPQQPNIYLEVVGNNDSAQNWAFFAPHENELVANQYLAKQIVDKGGVFVVLRQKGKRLIVLDIDDKKITIDPNRIFTKHGRITNLTKLNPNINQQPTLIHKAEQRAAKLSQFVLNALSGKKPPKTIIALHNNSNGYEDDGKNGIGDVSITRYQKKLTDGAKYLIDISNGQYDEDDLYFLTDKNDFVTTRNHGWNAVLQNPNVAFDPEEDDGSLSVYAEMKGYRYINVEAERITDGVGEDHLSVQTKMIDFTFSLLEK